MLTLSLIGKTIQNKTSIVKCLTCEKRFDCLVGQYRSICLQTDLKDPICLLFIWRGLFSLRMAKSSPVVHPVNSLLTQTFMTGVRHPRIKNAARDYCSAREKKVV